MSFAFKSRRRAVHQVRVIAGEQVDKALQALETGAEDFDATVHALRRRCKKLRGLLRMIEPHFKDFARENRAVREAADLLGGARDAQVMVETLDTLVSTNHAAASEAIAARQVLQGRVEALSASQGRAAILAQFAGILHEQQQRIIHWKLSERGFAVVGDGLEKTYRQFCRDAAEARKHGTAEAFHEWRKQAKYHGHHVGLLAKTAPDILAPRGKALVRLGDVLGDHHNLAVLSETLSEEADRLGGLSEISRAIVGRQAELAEQALGLGRQLAAEKPAALRQRFAAYWQLLEGET